MDLKTERVREAAGAVEIKAHGNQSKSGRQARTVLFSYKHLIKAAKNNVDTAPSAGKHRRVCLGVVQCLLNN